MLIDAGGRYAPSLRALNLKSEEPEFSQIGVAVFFKSFDGTPLNTWDRHLYGVRGAMISGSRIRPGLYRYILEADLAEKQSDRLGASSFTSQSRASTINGSTSASCESRAWAGNGRWRRSDIASAPSRGTAAAGRRCGGVSLADNRTGQRIRSANRKAGRNRRRRGFAGRRSLSRRRSPRTSPGANTRSSARSITSGPDSGSCAIPPR